MRGGVGLLEACMEIEEARENILQKLSLDDKEKAKYIFRILDTLSKKSDSFIHSLFLAGAVFLFMMIPYLAEKKLGFGFLIIPLISLAVGIISHKTINHLYYDRKYTRLLKELAGKMTIDPGLKTIFWKIRQDCHPADLKLTNRVWKEGISK
jgi:hypothetical protein